MLVKRHPKPPNRLELRTFKKLTTDHPPNAPRLTGCNLKAVAYKIYTDPKSVDLAISSMPTAQGGPISQSVQARSFLLRKSVVAHASRFNKLYSIYPSREYYRKK
jgi:hypothetical protein